MNKVDGVVVKTNEITLRTDSVIIEALLGQADALDAYAMEVQHATAAAKTLANRRESLIQETVSAIADPVERGKIFASLVAAGNPPVQVPKPM